MEAKLSSVTTMSDTSLVTSVPVIPRHAYIRLFHRRRVIDAVACHRDDIVAAAPGADDPQLMLRRDAGINRDLVHLAFKLLLAEPVQFLPRKGERVLFEEAQLPGDGHRGVLVVARNHDRLDAGGHALLDRLPDFLARRIDHRDQADEGQVLFDRVGIELADLPVQGPVRYAEDSHRLIRQFVVGFHDLLFVFGRQRPNGFLHLDVRAIGQQHIGRALDERDATAALLTDDRHLLALRVERQLIDERRGPLLLVLLNTGLAGDRQQRAFRGISHDLVARLTLHQLGAVAQHADAQGLHQLRVIVRAHLRAVQHKVPLGHVADPGHLKQFSAGKDRLHGHLVLGQRAGLVRTDHGGAAQGLDRAQPADQRVALHHSLHAQCQGDRDHGGQALRNRGNRQTDGGQEHLDHLAPAQPFERKDHRHEHETQVHDPFAELLQFFLQRRGFALDLLDHAGDLAQLGLHAGLGHDALGPARGDGRAQVHHIGPVRQRDFTLLQGRCRLDHGRGFARTGLCTLLEVSHVRWPSAECCRPPVHDVAETARNDDLACCCG
jgi:hypothetical protein